MPTDPEVVRYQNEIERLMGLLIGADIPIQTEWRSEFGNGIYSPRVDIAVGPFATTEGERLIEQYDRMYGTYHELVNNLIDIHRQNTQEETSREEIYYRTMIINPNARCFMAIEVEKSGSRKHLMGDAVNATALGRIGIVVGWTPEMFRAFLNLKRYFDYLGSVGKNTFNLGNLLIVDRNQLIEAILRVL